MANLQQLKEQARALEQGGQLQAALELFARAAQPDGADSAEPSVLLHLGELQRRAGQDGEAVASFERAADALAEAGLRNCALAVCARILELDAAHDPAYLRMGQLAAELGYARDARHGYLEFAERRVRQGDSDAALHALRGYLAHFPDDAAARRLLVEVHRSRGDLHAAVPQLESLQTLLRGRGAASGAAAIAQELAALRGELGIEAEPDPGPPVDQLPASSLQPLPEAASPDAYGNLELEPTAIPNAGPERSPSAHVQPLEGLEPTLAHVEPEPAGDDGGLPLLGMDTGEEGGEPDEAEPLPLLGNSFEVDAPWGAPEPAAPAPETDVLQRLQDRIEAQPADLDAWRRLIALLRERGDTGELRAVLRRAHPQMARAGHPEEAADLVERLGELEPLDSAELQLRVDYAARAGDQPRLIAALLALANGLLAERDLAAADAAFRRVLELDPHNVEAQRAVHSHAPSSARGGDDFVDLAALILGDEAEDLPPLPALAAPRPGGDEDFGDVIALLGGSPSAAQAAPQDASSHYDLGVAFKEMGLLDDALGQLRIALRGGADPLATLEVLGECVFRKGDPELAVRVLSRAAELRGASDTDLLGVHYWLGRCEQAAGRLADAAGWYQRVSAVDAAFRDVAERLEELRPL